RQLERPGVRMVAKQLSVHHIAGHYVHQALPRYVVADVARICPLSRFYILNTVIASRCAPHPRRRTELRGQRAGSIETVSRILTRWAKSVRVFMLIPGFGPNSGSLRSPFGQGAGVP